MKKLIFVVLLALGLCACAAKTLHCDGCGKELKTNAGSNMDESWIVYCQDCEPVIEGLD